VWGPGDTQLIGRIVSRARQGRLAVIGSGAALIDSTYIDNAADALVAAADRAGVLGGRAFVVSNGQPRPIRELLNRIASAAGLERPRLRVPVAVARTAGTVIERAWERLHREDDPPITRFLAEQLSTAHWFDQRETRRALGWQPEVDLDEGFARLESWFRASPSA
jgi:nucleoside-diphosphate-sugar epimerase